MISIEEELRKIISKRINRGKVDVFINYKSYDSNNIVPKLDINLAKKYYYCLKELEDTLGITDDITVSKISKFPEVLTLEIEDVNLEEVILDLRLIVNQALDMMVDMREKEGEKLKEDIIIKVSEIESEVKKVQSLALDVPIQYKKKLNERIDEITKGLKIDEGRIALEIAIFADKAFFR